MPRVTFVIIVSANILSPIKGFSCHLFTIISHYMYILGKVDFLTAKAFISQGFQKFYKKLFFSIYHWLILTSKLLKKLKKRKFIIVFHILLLKRFKCTLFSDSDLCYLKSWSTFLEKYPRGYFDLKRENVVWHYIPDFVWTNYRMFCRCN